MNQTQNQTCELTIINSNCFNTLGSRVLTVIQLAFRGQETGQLVLDLINFYLLPNQAGENDLS